jgi:hypothetical protein
MDADFQAIIEKYRARVTVLRDTFDRDRCLYAVSAQDPTYALLLIRNGSSEAPWRVTSFRDGAHIASQGTASI